MTHVSNLCARLKRVSSSGAAYLAVTVLAGLSMVPGAVAQTQQEVSQEPLYLGGGGVPGNLVLTPSVEYPTIQSLAHPTKYDSPRSGLYTTAKRFEGYFDADKCYEYVDSQNEKNRHFRPSSKTTDRTCQGDKEWSGNFLNWAVTQTIDPFRKVLTGGYRFKDEINETWLEKARHPGTEDIKTKVLEDSTKALVKGATPFDSTKISVRIKGLGTDMRFSIGNTSVDASDDRYGGGKTITTSKSYRAAVRVKVCVLGMLEDNCKQYGENWKPEGLLQQHADRIRYSVFGYLNDDDAHRDGGVLRARQKYIGPRKFEGSQGFTENPEREWDPETGVLFKNPNPQDASDTTTKITIENSGVINYINKFGQLNTNTHKSHDPVSELYYAATRYLKNQGNVPSYSSLSGLNTAEITKYTDNFPVISNWDGDDPIQFACQPNVILGIGDANTHRDGNLPQSSFYGDEPTLPSEVSSDDTVDVTTMTSKVGELEGISYRGGNESFTGRENTAYIAGLAYNNLTVDMRPDLGGKQTASTHWVDVMEAGVLELPEKNQYYLATKYGGFKVPDDFDPETRTESLEESWWHTNGDLLTGWDGTKFKRPDNFYIAGEANKMIESLREAFHNISNELSSSSSSIAANSTSLENETAIYQASFNSARWSGELVAYALDGITISEESFWRAAEVLDDENKDMDDRKILTAAPLAEVETGSGVYLTDNGSEFTWTGLTAAQQSALALTGSSNADGSAVTVTTAVARDRLNYLRGDRSNEQTAEITSRPFRQRGSRLGDIINSSPVYVHQENYGYFRLHTQEGYTGMDENTYASFRDSNTYKNRPPFLLVGANDGMLHAFNASVTVGEGGGEELFAYVPSSIIGDLWKLTEPDYVHRYYVDASPVVSDAWLGSTLGWRTLAVGTTGAGGRSVFALDVTNPRGMTASNVLWEFTHDEMGLTMQKPGIFALANGQFGVAVSSGYGRDAFLAEGDDALTTGKVWFLDAATGSVIKEITIPTGGAELGSPLLIDINADRIADRMYVADTAGNVWRVDINSDDTNNWQEPTGLTANNGDMLPLFEAVMPPDDADDPTKPAVPQPITADLTAAMNEYGGIMVFFGTGSFQNVGDNIVGNPAAVQSFYGIIDRGVPVARVNLLEQKILDEVVNAQGNRLRLVSANKPPAPHYGWYMDLVVAKQDATAEGERVVSQALVRSDRVIFPTLIPSADPCASGGRSWLMEVDLYSGSRLDYEVFDTDNDGDIDEQDRIPGGDDEGDVPPSGIDPDIGIIQKPTIIENCKDGDECKIVSGSSGQAEVIQEKGIEPVGRIRWEQLR